MATKYARTIAAPVAHYKLNDNAASTVVVNEKGTNGALGGGDTTATKSIVGKINGALQFNGIDDYVNTNQTFSTLLSGAFSISSGTCLFRAFNGLLSPI